MIEYQNIMNDEMNKKIMKEMHLSLIVNAQKAKSCLTENLKNLESDIPNQYLTISFLG